MKSAETIIMMGMRLHNINTCRLVDYMTVCSLMYTVFPRLVAMATIFSALQVRGVCRGRHLFCCVLQCTAFLIEKAWLSD